MKRDHAKIKISNKIVQQHSTESKDVVPRIDVSINARAPDEKKAIIALMLRMEEHEQTIVVYRKLAKHLLKSGFEKDILFHELSTVGFYNNPVVLRKSCQKYVSKFCKRSNFEKVLTIFKCLAQFMSWVRALMRWHSDVSLSITNAAKP